MKTIEDIKLELIEAEVSVYGEMVRGKIISHINNLNLDILLCNAVHFEILTDEEAKEIASAQ